MRKTMIIVLAAVLAISFNCCTAKTYSANMEKFNVQVTINESVQINDEFPPSFYQDFTAYLVDIWIGNDLFEVIIQDYDSSTDISESALKHANQITYPMENEKSKSWIHTDVGGQNGLIASVQYAASMPKFEVVYSPDASGNSGTVIVTITAYTGDKKKVEDVLKTLQINRI